MGARSQKLFATRLRGTGGGFCFNVGLVLAAPMLFASGPLQKEWGLTRENAASLRSPAFAPETRATELPE